MMIMTMVRSCAIKSGTRSVFRACFLSGIIGSTAWADDHACVDGGALAKSAQAATDADSIGFSLSANAADALRRHTMLSEELETHPSMDNACTLARSAQKLAPLLAVSLQFQRASVSTPAEGGDTSAFLSLEERLNRADTLLVGIGLHLGAEVAYSYVRYDEIADVGGAQNDGAALFRAVSKMWHNPTGWPTYVEQQTDVTGCHDPGALITPLENVALTWDLAPECVRSVVVDAVRQSVGGALSSASCYCRTREEVFADTARLAELAGSVELGIPKSEVDALQTHLGRDGVRFECLAN
jgi:hypothetical protein